jgi:type I restriction enzyme S subunit
MWAIKRLNNYDKWVVTTLYICFQLKEELKYDSDYFENYFQAWSLVKWLQKVAQEWARAHWLLNITPTDFFNLKISIPDWLEQKAIADVLNKATEQLNLYKDKLEKFESEKKGLMQQLLTGKVRVKF